MGEEESKTNRNKEVVEQRMKVMHPRGGENEKKVQANEGRAKLTANEILFLHQVKQ